jgi:hypothetical protein
MKTALSLLIGVGLSWPLLAQPTITLRLAFNADQNRYEVYAKPTFTAPNYTWGPSQVSVVLPADVADGSLAVRSTEAGLWLDQSAVFAPASAPNDDFHGFASQGGKTDLVANEEHLLFDFSMPQGFVVGVRLFDNQIDPSSAHAGMQGGDFSSYLSNDKGEQAMLIDTHQPELTGPTATKSFSDDAARKAVLEGDVVTKVIVYPNPSSHGTFRLYLQGFAADEVVDVRLSSVSGKLLYQFSESVSKLAIRAITATNAPDDFLVVTVTRPGLKQHFSQKVLIKE